ncbi:MAG: hypothetical protein WBS19_09320 [Candidatus Korobacteraceae bacterium]
MKKLLLTIVGLLVLSSLALAQATTDTTTTSGTGSRQPRKNIRTGAGISCGSDPILPTDGLAVQDFVDVSSVSYYLVHLKDGHSYSAEVYDSLDATITATAQLGLISSSDCTTVLPTMDVASMDPDLTASFSDRISWIQVGDSDAVLTVTNGDSANSYVYTVRIVDTTLHNPRWSTYSGYHTQYALVNNTETSITGNLTVYDSTGNVVAAYTAISVPAAAENFVTVASPTNKFGFATFAFVGPAGAITADAYFVNPSINATVPSTFAPRNYQH